MSGTASASFRSLVLPKEHGSWAFAFEPVLLGLLIAPSRPGLALAGAIIAGFFVRRPLKLAVTLPTQDDRRRPALRWAVLWSALALVGITGAAVLGSGMTLWPLILCAPFGALFLWFDLRNDMREVEAELSGSTTFALIPATFATLAGWSPAPALALAALMLARSFPTVLTMRTYLRHAKGQSTHAIGSFITAGAACALITTLAIKGIVPVTGALLTAGLFLHTIILLTSLRPTCSAKRIGQSECVIGLLYVAGLALGYHYHF